MKTLYAVMQLNTKAKVQTLGNQQEIELSWIHGQVGAIPVFDNREKALKYTKGKLQIFKLKLIK